MKQAASGSGAELPSTSLESSGADLTTDLTAETQYPNIEDIKNVKEIFVEMIELEWVVCALELKNGTNYWLSRLIESFAEELEGAWEHAGSKHQSNLNYAK